MVQEDRDGDRVPDDWEIAHGLNPDDPSDAALDEDGDGRRTRKSIWRARTTRRASCLRITGSGLSHRTNGGCASPQSPAGPTPSRLAMT